MSGHPGHGGHTDGLTWFVEPDRWWELTAVADDTGTRLDHLELWRPPDTGRPAVPGRRDVRRIAQRAARGGISAGDIWAHAAELGDACDVSDRRRAAHLLVLGREPPMT